ncbi:MAG: GNAT family N-acetyltransferase [Geminicoccaceae bacterium]
MKCEFFSDAASFLDVATPFLAESEAENTVLVGRALRYVDRPRSDAVMAVVRRPHQCRVHAGGGARQGLRIGLLAALSRQLLDRGWRCCLIFADRDHPTTTRIHPRLGYREIAGFATIGFRYDG